MYRQTFASAPLKAADPEIDQERSYVVIGFILSAVSGFLMGLLAHWLF